MCSERIEICLNTGYSVVTWVFKCRRRVPVIKGAPDVLDMWSAGVLCWGDIISLFISMPS